MVVESYRARGERVVLPLAQFAHRLGFSPDGLTLLSLGLAVVAGGLLWSGQQGQPVLLALGGVFVWVSAMLDAVDGRLARLQGSATPRGDYLDHVTDRYADLAILLGIGLAPGMDARFLLLAVVGTLLTSYMGTQAQAVGVGRNYKGLLSRADRLVLFGTVPLLEAAFSLAAGGAPVVGGLPLLAWLLLFIGVMGNLTALQRFAAGWRELTRKPRA